MSRLPRFHALALVLAGLVSSSAAWAVNTMSGNLESFLNSIDYGAKYAADWKEPSAETMAQYRLAVDYFLNGQYQFAHEYATPIGFEVIEFTHGSGKKAKVHYLLWETAQLPSSQFIGGGTLVTYPQGLNMVIQAPHPKSDLNTGIQATNTYIKSEARYLMLPGTRRNNSIAVSDCDPSYPESDASHNDKQLFYVAHQALTDHTSDPVFVQLHGFGSSSLGTLQNQCDSGNDRLVNLSEGVGNPLADSGSFMRLLQAKINAGGIIEACIYGEDTNYLGATKTTTGRYTNGSSNVCALSATQSSGRFVHVEQSYKVRSENRSDMQQYITDAAAEYFGGSSGGSGGGNGGGKGRKK